jgi:hypothetical protein
MRGFGKDVDPPGRKDAGHFKSKKEFLATDENQMRTDERRKTR